MPRLVLPNTRHNQSLRWSATTACGRSCSAVLQMLRDRGAPPTWESGGIRFTRKCARRNVRSFCARPRSGGFATLRIAFPTGARMKTSRLTLMLVAAAVAVSACNAPDANRTTKAPAGVDKSGSVVEPLVSRSAPPAPAERGPVASANAAAPGTDASAAMGQAPAVAQTPLPAAQSSATTAPSVVSAQQAAANAPDTASADAAKAAATGSAPTSGTARDTAANAPRTGTLTKEEESAQMPKAGQANNHSSPALETDSGKASKP